VDESGSGAVNDDIVGTSSATTTGLVGRKGASTRASIGGGATTGQTATAGSSHGGTAPPSASDAESDTQAAVPAVSLRKRRRGEGGTATTATSSTVAADTISSNNTGLSNLTSPNQSLVTGTGVLSSSHSALGGGVVPPPTRQSLSTSASSSWQCQNCAAPTARVSLARILELCVAQALYDLEISQDNGERKTGPSVKALLAPFSDESLQPLYAAYGYSLLPMLLQQQVSNSNSISAPNTAVVNIDPLIALDGLEDRVSALIPDISVPDGAEHDMVMTTHSETMEGGGGGQPLDLLSPKSGVVCANGTIINSQESNTSVGMNGTISKGSSAKSRALINAAAKLDPSIAAKAFSTGLEATCVPSTPATLSDFIACIRSCKYASVSEAIEDLRAFISAIHVLTGGTSSATNEGSTAVNSGSSESLAEWRSPTFNAAATDDVSMHAGSVKPYLPVLSMQTTTAAMARSTRIGGGSITSGGSNNSSRPPLVIAAGAVASAIEKAIMYPKKNAALLKEADEALVSARTSKEGGPPSGFQKVLLPKSSSLREAHVSAATYILMKRGGKLSSSQGGVSPEGSRSHTPTLLDGTTTTVSGTSASHSLFINSLGSQGGSQPKHGDWVIRLVEAMGIKEDNALARLYAARRSSSRPEIALCGTFTATFERLSLAKSSALVLSAVASKGEKLKNLEDRTVKAALVQRRVSHLHHHPRGNVRISGSLSVPMVTEKGGFVLKSSLSNAPGQRAASPTSAALIAYEETTSTSIKGSGGGDTLVPEGESSNSSATTSANSSATTSGSGDAHTSSHDGVDNGDISSTKGIFDAMFKSETELIAEAASKYLASVSVSTTSEGAMSVSALGSSHSVGSHYHTMLESEPGLVFSTFDRHIAGVAKSYFAAAVSRKERLNHQSAGGGNANLAGESQLSTSPTVEGTESALIPDTLVNKFEVMATWAKRITSSSAVTATNLNQNAPSKISAPVAVKAGADAAVSTSGKGGASSASAGGHASASLAPLQQSTSWVQLRRQLQEQNAQQRHLVEANERSILSTLGLLQLPLGTSPLGSSEGDPISAVPSINSSDINGLLGLSGSTGLHTITIATDTTPQQHSFAPVYHHQQQQQQQQMSVQAFKQQQFLVHSLLSQERRIAEQDSLLNAAVSMLSSQLEGLRSAILSSTPTGLGNNMSARSFAHQGGDSNDTDGATGMMWGPTAEAQRIRSIISRMPPRDRVGAQILFELAPLDGEDGGLTSLAHLLPPSEDEVTMLFDSLSTHHRRAMIAAGELRSAWTASRRGLFTVPALVDEDSRLLVRASASASDEAVGGGENIIEDGGNTVNNSGGVITLGEGNLALEYAIANANLRERTAQLEIELAAARVRLGRSETQGV
jgi:hypothetical protein